MESCHARMSSPHGLAECDGSRMVCVRVSPILRGTDEARNKSSPAVAEMKTRRDLIVFTI